MIGIGTARRYYVAAIDEEVAPLREVLRNFPGMGDEHGAGVTGVVAAGAVARAPLSGLQFIVNRN